LFVVSTSSGGITSNSDTVGKRAVFRRHLQDTRSSSLQFVVPVNLPFSSSKATKVLHKLGQICYECR